MINHDAITTRITKAYGQLAIHNDLIGNRTELINSIEITIAIDIFGTIAIAIVKRISQLLLLLLLLIRSSISIDFFSLFGICFSELLQWA